MLSVFKAWESRRTAVVGLLVGHLWEKMLATVLSIYLDKTTEGLEKSQGAFFTWKLIQLVEIKRTITGKTLEEKEHDICCKLEATISSQLA